MLYDISTPSIRVAQEGKVHSYQETLCVMHDKEVKTKDYSSPLIARSYSARVNSYPHCQRHCLSTAPISSSSRAGIPPFRVTFLSRDLLNRPVGPATLSPGGQSPLFSHSSTRVISRHTRSHSEPNTHVTSLTGRGNGVNRRSRWRKGGRRRKRR